MRRRRGLDRPGDIRVHPPGCRPTGGAAGRPGHPGRTTRVGRDRRTSHPDPTGDRGTAPTGPATQDCPHRPDRPDRRGRGSPEDALTGRTVRGADADREEARTAGRSGRGRIADRRHPSSRVRARVPRRSGRPGRGRAGGRSGRNGAGRDPDPSRPWAPCVPLRGRVERSSSSPVSATVRNGPRGPSGEPGRPGRERDVRCGAPVARRRRETSPSGPPTCDQGIGVGTPLGVPAAGVAGARGDHRCGDGVTRSGEGGSWQPRFDTPGPAECRP